MVITNNSVIEKIKQGYAQFSHICQNVPATDLSEPELSDQWCVKDVIGHISAWVWRCAFLLEHAHYTDAPLEASPDVAGLNKEFYQQIKTLDWLQVEIEFYQAHQALYKAIRELPPNRINDEVVRTFIAKNTWLHYAEHLPELEQWYANQTKQFAGVLEPGWVVA